MRYEIKVTIEQMIEFTTTRWYNLQIAQNVGGSHVQDSSHPSNFQ